MFATFLALIFFKLVLSSFGLRMIMLDVPSPANFGESVELTCSYELGQDTLYSIKWYKNDIEFYRYVPNDWPPGQFLPLPGIRVDLSKSGKRSVFLRSIDLNSTGTYRCEVSAESPTFQTVEAEAEMTVMVLPTEGPTISGGQPLYDVGDLVYVNCTSAKSKPAAKLVWLINDTPILPTQPGYEIEHSTTLHADGLETCSLSLSFMATHKHFKEQLMRLRCTATIPRLYTMSNEKSFIGSNQLNSPLEVTEDIEHISQPIKKIKVQTERVGSEGTVEKYDEPSITDKEDDVDEENNTEGEEDEDEEEEEPTSSSRSSYSVNHWLFLPSLILLVLALFSCTAIKHRLTTDL